MAQIDDPLFSMYCIEKNYLMEKIKLIKESNYPESIKKLAVERFESYLF